MREAIISGIILGGFYLFLARAGAHAGLQPLLTARVASAAFLTVVALALRRPVAPNLGAMPLVLLCGVLDMLANMFYVLAAMHGYVSIAAVLTSLYPASTVLLAAILLRERLARVQYFGLGLALGGVGLISL